VVGLLSRDFVECEGCAGKPGSPYLCPSCLHNRNLIADLKKYINVRESDYLRLRDERDRWQSKYRHAVEFAEDVRRRSRGEDS
jgi:hypothetical protein